jgi:hypothetical protein
VGATEGFGVVEYYASIPAWADLALALAHLSPRFASYCGFEWILHSLGIVAKLSTQCNYLFSLE